MTYYNPSNNRQDFAVAFDPATETQQDLIKKILYATIIRPIKDDRPIIIFLSGDSGVGKSMSAIRLQEILMEIQGESIKPYFSVMNVYTPLEYGQKMDLLLKDRKYRKANIICIHEAREVVKAKRWFEFTVQAVADINAMSRAIKPMCIIIVSQFIRDISADLRYTLNMYIKVERYVGGRPRLYIYKMWKDDSDLEKPRLKKRRLQGMIKLPDGRYKKVMPEFIELGLPDDEIKKQFQKEDFESKNKIIKRKLEQTITDMQIESGEAFSRIEKLVEYYSKHMDELESLGKVKSGKFRLSSEFKKAQNLTPAESEFFEVEIIKKTLKDRFEKEQKILEKYEGVT